MNRIGFLRVLLALLMCIAVTPARSAVVEGYQFDDEVVGDGHTLVLNGAGWRKRGYAKVDVLGLYLEHKMASIDAVLRNSGRARIVLRPLRDLSGAVISKYFVSDFEQAASATEFKSVISDVINIGGVFARVHEVHKGDVVAIDWTPGKGMSASINGKSLQLDDAGDIYLNSELMFKIVLRMHLVVTASDELRQNLLGQSDSMRGTAP